MVITVGSFENESTLVYSTTEAKCCFHLFKSIKNHNFNVFWCLNWLNLLKLLSFVFFLLSWKCFYPVLFQNRSKIVDWFSQKKQKTSKLHDFIAKMMLKLPEIKEIQIMKSWILNCSWKKISLEFWNLAACTPLKGVRTPAVPVWGMTTYDHR